MKITTYEHSNDMDVLFSDVFNTFPQLKTGKTVLQIGARPGGGYSEMFQGFRKYGYNRFDILEIFQPNVDVLKNDNTIDNIICGDVRLIDQYNDLLEKYDVIVPWHIIEHLPKCDVSGVLKKIFSKCNIANIVGVPDGVWKQGAIKNNPYEKHLCSLYPKDFEKFGFSNCYRFNDKNKKAGSDHENVMFGIMVYA